MGDVDRELDVKEWALGLQGLKSAGQPGRLETLGQQPMLQPTQGLSSSSEAPVLLLRPSVDWIRTPQPPHSRE